MLAHTRELSFLQPKFIGPLRPTVATCSTGATQNTPGFIFVYISMARRFLCNLPPPISLGEERKRDFDRNCLGHS